MKLISILLLTFCTLSANSQTLSAQNMVRGKGYAGYIFSEDYSSRYLHLSDAVSRFTPTQHDIIQAEGLLKDKLAILNKDMLNQSGSCPIIHKHLNRYVRQYFGYIIKNGDRVIWINFIGGNEKKDAMRMSHDLAVILDGCSYYWDIKVNISKGQLSDLHVNASS